MKFHRIVKFISLLTVFTLFSSILPTSLYAQDRTPRPPVASSSPPSSSDSDDEMVYTLRMGEAAPFAGTLFSISAAARILTNLEFTQETCNLQINEKLRLSEANMQLRIDTERARFDALQYRHTELMRVRNDQIQFLTEQYRPRPWYQKGDFWFGVGTVTGVLITIAAGYALGLAN